MAKIETTHDCDVLVVGTGAGGLSAAVAARKCGANVIVVEKEELVGGTTATSGGVLWLPLSRPAMQVQATIGITDTHEAVRSHIIDQAGNYADPERVDAFLANVPEMVEFFERETEVEFLGVPIPDYHSEEKDGSVGRSMMALDYEASKLGRSIAIIKDQLPQTTFMGLSFGSTIELKEFQSAGRSIGGLFYVFRKMSAHLLSLAMHGRPERLARGRALVGRLMRTLLDLDVPVWVSSPLQELTRDDSGAVTGAVIEAPNGRVVVRANRGVILATGGFPNDVARRKVHFPKLAGDAGHRSLASPGNTGDGIRAAEAVGGQFTSAVCEVAAWAPASIIPKGEGPVGLWPHFLERQKPGFIMVTRNGKRFASEALSYHDFVPALLRACEGEDEAYCYLVGDKRAVNRWGIGRVRPAPLPRRHHIRSGYLIEGKTVGELAEKIGIDRAELERTISTFNANAVRGVDPEYERGSRRIEQFYGDDEIKPNPCLGPLDRAPYYAVRVLPSELGTFAGLATDASARVLDTSGLPIAGLYAVGNDQASVFGGAYCGAGATLGPAMTFGYIAGRHAARKG